MSVKLTLVFDNPTDPAEFESGFAGSFVSLATAVPDVQRVESAKVFPKEDGTPTPAWRTVDIYFSDYDTAVAAFGTPEGGALFAKMGELATGGVRPLLSDIEVS